MTLPDWQIQDHFWLDQRCPALDSSFLYLHRNICQWFGRYGVKQCHDEKQRRTATFSSDIEEYGQQFFPKFLEVFFDMPDRSRNESKSNMSQCLSLTFVGYLRCSGGNDFEHNCWWGQVVSRPGNLRIFSLFQKNKRRFSTCLAALWQATFRHLVFERFLGLTRLV